MILDQEEGIYRPELYRQLSSDHERQWKGTRLVAETMWRDSCLGTPDEDTGALDTSLSLKPCERA